MKERGNTLSRERDSLLSLPGPMPVNFMTPNLFDVDLDQYSVIRSALVLVFSSPGNESHRENATVVLSAPWDNNNCGRNVGRKHSALGEHVRRWTGSHFPWHVGDRKTGATSSTASPSRGYRCNERSTRSCDYRYLVPGTVVA
jgi:hypothetical protein